MVRSCFFHQNKSRVHPTHRSLRANKVSSLTWVLRDERRTTRTARFVARHPVLGDVKLSTVSVDISAIGTYDSGEKTDPNVAKSQAMYFQSEHEHLDEQRDTGSVPVSFSSTHGHYYNRTSLTGQPTAGLYIHLRVTRLLWPMPSCGQW